MQSNFRIGLKKSLPTLLFDMVAFITFYLALRFGGGGPCNAGLYAFFVLIIAGLASGMLLMYHLANGFIKKKKESFTIALLHILAWAIFLGILFLPECFR